MPLAETGNNDPKLPARSNAKVIATWLWWIGLLLLFTLSLLWFSEVPGRLYAAFPYPVEQFSPTWYNRAKLSGILGLCCWGLAPLAWAFHAIKNPAPTTLSLGGVLLRIFIALIALCILALAGFTLLLMSIDFSDTPQ